MRLLLGLFAAFLVWPLSSLHAAGVDLDICVLESTAQSNTPCAAKVTALWGDSSTFVGSNMGGIRLNKNLTTRTPIRKHGSCYFVDNLSDQDFFVPFRSSDEWDKFIANHPKTSLKVTPCALPYSGYTFGPSSALPDPPMNDRNDSASGPKATTTAPVDLPYWRAGAVWPPLAFQGAVTSCPTCTHTFNHACYQEYAAAACRKYCSVTDKTGKTTTYCCDWGSTCEKNWQMWQEIFDFVATGKKGTTGANSWTPRAPKASVRIGGNTRPEICNERCEGSDGHDCLGCPSGDPDFKIDGVCSAINGDSLSAKPALIELCAAGTPKNLSGTGPWTWVCAGSGGGTSINCGAQTNVVNGVCGTANGQQLDSAPSGAALCDKGKAGAVTAAADGKSWSWPCNGENGGTNAACAATLKPVPINGKCGTAQNQTLSSPPSGTAQCEKGTASAVITSTGTYNWSCLGQNGGSNISCSALRTSIVNGKCGSAANVASSTFPSGGLCAEGSAANGAFSSNYWLWSCVGSNGGSTKNCSAPFTCTVPATRAQSASVNFMCSGCPWPACIISCANYVNIVNGYSSRISAYLAAGNCPAAIQETNAMNNYIGSF